VLFLVFILAGVLLRFSSVNLDLISGTRQTKAEEVNISGKQLRKENC
jgi:hypothetical protein